MYEELFCKDMVKKPYTGTREHLEDLFCLLDAYLNVVFLVRGKKEDEIENLVMRGLTIDEGNISKALMSHSLERKAVSLSQNLQDDISKMLMHIDERVTASIKAGVELRFIMISQKFNLTLFERFCFILSLACDYNRNYENLYGVLQNDMNERLPTKGLAISLYELTDSIEDWEIANLISGNGCLGKYILAKQYEEHKNISKLSERIYIKKEVVGYLLNPFWRDSSIMDMISIYDYRENIPKMVIHEDIFNRIMKVVKAYMNFGKEAENGLTIHIYGPSGVGKRFIVKHIAEELKVKLLFFDISKLICEEEKDVEDTLLKVLLEALFCDAFVCFTGVDFSEKDQSQKNQLFRILKYIQSEWSFFFLLSEYKSEQFKYYKTNRISVEVPMLSAKEKILIWKDCGENYKIAKDVDLESNGNKYALTAKEIISIFDIAKVNANGNGREIIHNEDIISAIKQQQVSQLGEYADMINAVFTWDDLILDDVTKQQLKMICNRLKYRDIVGEEWGFYQKTPYGNGLSVLFYGAPGTGKTMAVQVMANELGLDLYRIDLSLIVSKYIGETEKNITGLFNRAKNINAILFFDEADALFAKRSEVKDSNDRNANMMTSHLLQKLEDYDGIAVLASNYVNNIDDAFKRRIKFMVNFVFPTADVRYQIWKSILPKEAKCSEEIDFNLFSDKFELSGSSIKEILTNAAYFAASEHSGLGNRHVMEAVKIHFAKYGKMLSGEEFGYLQL